MIKFFHKIRQSALFSNKNSKYLKYAVGEILLVMIGILLALQVNNWNEDKKKQAKLDLNLQSLVENLRSDILMMERVESVNLFRFYSMQYLLEMAGEPTFDATKIWNLDPKPYTENIIWEEPIPDTYNEEFVYLAFLWTQRLVQQKTDQSAIRELKSSGMFSYLDNLDLKRSINFYYKSWDNRIGEHQIAKHLELIKQWESSLGKEGILTSEALSLEDPLGLFKDNKERVYLLKRLIREAAWEMYSATLVKEAGQALIQSIEKELKN